MSAVLHFGNLEFKQERSSDQAILPDNTVAQKICKLLGLSVTDYTKAMLKPKIKTGREFTVRSQNKTQVEFSCYALAKALYERLFKWIVARINKSLDRSVHNRASFIGILDIAGFEIFKVGRVLGWAGKGGLRGLGWSENGLGLGVRVRGYGEEEGWVTVREKERESGNIILILILLSLIAAKLV